MVSMKSGRVVNTTRQVDLAARAELASSFLSRAVGLMGRTALPPDYGLVIKPCGSIHMFFMRIPLDVCQVDKEGRILKILHEIKPWRVGPIVWRSAWVVELPAGTVRRTGAMEGDHLAFIETRGSAGPLGL